MRGADLVTESPREDEDDRQGDHVHELCNHEHGIADDDRMTGGRAPDAKAHGA